MRKTFTFLILFIFGLSAIGFFVNYANVTGKSVSYIENEKIIQKYSYTKAFCDNNNECADFLIYCEENLPVKIEKISKTVKFNYKVETLDEEICEIR